MALPSGVLTTLVTFGKYTDFAGGFCSGTVTIVPDTELLWTNGDVIEPVGFVVQISAATGTGSVQIPFTDQTGFSDGRGTAKLNWTYTAKFALKSPLGETVPKANSSFTVPSAFGSTVDYDQLVGVTSSTGSTIPTTGVTGIILPGSSTPQTGIVTIPAAATGSTTVAQITNATTIGQQLLLAGDANSVKVLLGLDQVTNTADAGKPVSAATLTALNGKADATTVTNALALKANVADLTAAVATLVPKTDEIAYVVRWTTSNAPTRPATNHTVLWISMDGSAVPGGGTTSGGGGSVANLDVILYGPTS